MSTSKTGNTPGKRTPNKKAAGGKATPATKSVSTTDFTDDVVLTTTATELLIDCRMLAQGFGNKRRTAIALIDKYLGRFERFGKVRFKKAPLIGSKTGQSERYALLNEDQSYLLLSLSRNSETVVDLKVKLVKAFGEARRAAELRKTEYLPCYRVLHDQIKTMAAGSPSERFMHINCNKALNQFAGLAAGQRAGAPMPKQALLIVGQVMMTQAMQTAPNPIDGFQRAKASLMALTTCTMLEVAHGD